MEYNIDILVAGCNTTCNHCYVNGGKAPSMELEDFLCCINKLKPVFSHLGDKVSFTLDNEIYNHPSACEILEVVERECAKNYYHHGSTTGIAILKHPQRQVIFEVLKRNNWLDVSFAIHGGRSSHNKMVHNEDGMEAILAASRMFKEHGFEVNISLMLSKVFGNELEEIDELLKQIPYDRVLPVIPDFYPTARLMKYQDIRCNVEDYEKILEFLEARNIDTSELKYAIKTYNEEAIITQLNVELVQKQLNENETAFFHIDQKLNFYVGNTGATQKCCGNLKECSSEEIISWIVDSKDNYYETETIHYEGILKAILEKELQISIENYVYPNRIAAIIAMIQNRK